MDLICSLVSADLLGIVIYDLRCATSGRRVFRIRCSDLNIGFWYDSIVGGCVGSGVITTIPALEITSPFSFVTIASDVVVVSGALVFFFDLTSVTMARMSVVATRTTVTMKRIYKPLLFTRRGL